MDIIMLVLFGIGAGYALLSLVFGDWLGFDFHSGDLPYLSPTVIATFLNVFGGIGYMLLNQTDWSMIAVASVSLISALAVSSVVLFAVVLPLHAAQKGMAKSAKAMIGLAAEVVTAIKAPRLGEIVYEQGGTRHSAPAKSAGEPVISQGTSVRIVGEMAGTFVVETW
ncbi:NfeD family protein [Cohnella faecalis]|uniref:Membrane protein NfeD2 N-terminal transmembrane domain-containing protein n=1 Tax=Cohnella faecalis TaxID=2315694 RepID=A0A398CRV0_9BACL|nr:NfeD family protein [Cohnella faecalis]RIE03939.1 hypothetical protein D3H35_08215 [Cohnella faecalis]